MTKCLDCNREFVSDHAVSCHRIGGICPKMRSERKCPSCKEVKPIDKFYYIASLCSYKSYCKECCKKLERERTIKFKDKICGYKKKYYADNRETISYRQKEHSRENKDANNARSKAHYLLKESSVCEVCGVSTKEKHHDDYSKPLEVRFLCHRHHMQLHGRLRIKEVRA